MADATDRITSGTSKRDAPVRDAAAPPSAQGNGRPTDPEGMRQEIERTRARLSRTLDELETRIVEERQELDRRTAELWEKATLQGLRRRLSAEPWRSMAIAFAVGYMIAAIRE